MASILEVDQFDFTSSSWRVSAKFRNIWGNEIRPVSYLRFCTNSVLSYHQILISDTDRPWMTYRGLKTTKFLLLNFGDDLMQKN